MAEEQSLSDAATIPRRRTVDWNKTLINIPLMTERSTLAPMKTALLFLDAQFEHRFRLGGSQREAAPEYAESAVVYRRIFQSHLLNLVLSGKAVGLTIFIHSAYLKVL
jgi:hypothetical protein